MKGQVVPVLNYLSTMPWRRMWEWSYSSTFIYLDNRWRWMFIFTPRPLYAKERAPDTNWIGGWVGPRAGLDAVEWRKIVCPCRESNPGRPARRYTYWAILAPHILHIPGWKRLISNIRVTLLLPRAVRLNIKTTAASISVNRIKTKYS
jgi:hypothetical protein